MLYPKSKKEFSLNLFKSPTSEYRGAPFWSWNCKLNKDILLRQIEYLKEMGMGGFNIHSRTGMNSEYLGEEFMSLIKACNEKGKEYGMLTWLYDEDRWPSGFGGGLVTKDYKYRTRFLLFTKEVQTNRNFINEYNSTNKAIRSNDRTLLAVFEINLNNGFLESYRKLDTNEIPKEGSNIWYAYLEISGDNPWFNNQSYVNTLDKSAIDRFIQVTHEVYLKEFGPEFGSSIPAIFTDEPQFVHKQTLGFAEDENDIILPFTDDFEETYCNTYGSSFIEYIPELYWELPDGEVSSVRYRYHNHICDRFVQAFSKNISDWCVNHGIMLTGHMMAEETLDSQTTAVGEAMRSLSFFQLPGIDMLCDKRELSTAKQAQSVAHQYGRQGVMSEIYGVTNWDFDFRGHKLAGDWQAALGVTMRIHHLSWVSMEGESKRDYPASISYQSPWYKEYSFIEDHFSRLNTILTRGKPIVKVGVIHPIESNWLYYGPQEQTSIIREELQNNFKNIIDWLLFGLVDFDFISEALLPELSKDTAISNNIALKVGEMEYETILIPANLTLRSSTLEILKTFKKLGGDVIFLGEVAEFVDGQKSSAALDLARKCKIIPFTKAKVLSSVQKYKDIDIKKDNGTSSDNLFYQFRVDGDKKWLFISHVNKTINSDLGRVENITIKIKGHYNIFIYDTLVGDVYPCSAKISGDNTIIYHEFYEHDSLLLCLESGIPQCIPVSKEEVPVECKELLNERVPISLSEPNVLVLDIAEYSLDNGPWRKKEELLKIDNELRELLGFPIRMEAFAQPWLKLDTEKTKNLLSLRFYINSQIEVRQAKLALENPDITEIMVNGNVISKASNGWFVDECIKTVQLPNLPKGKSEIILNIPFGRKTNIEWCYLLGDFGVEADGAKCTIIEPVRELNFGDWTHQGLPFYAGNVTYHCEITCDAETLSVEAPLFRNPLLTVTLDNIKKATIAFSPYKAIFEHVPAGKHKLNITAFGNRINAFGALHNCDKSTTWFGPNAWRTVGNSWSYEYQFKQMGILKTPTILIR